ncbi:MAG: hypothetical protein K2M90_03110, partial [Treponemataceae bacterium]|nr:hypothetical protein [Treponemataceae bacterium]
VTLFAQRYFGVERTVSHIKRSKFSEKLLPDTTVVFHLTYDGEQKSVSFKVQDLGATVTYASGVYLTAPAAE